MRGAERPAKVRWSYPFFLPLQLLKHHAAQQTFIDIAEDHHNPEEVDRMLSLTDNMPFYQIQREIRNKQSSPVSGRHLPCSG
jgi:hypothetical protein